ncbi:MAG: hypothetical protein Q9162_000744 [Coniocarpon cinnabarinum]
MPPAKYRSTSPTESSSSPEEAATSASHSVESKPRRTRASNAKVKTGCLTCKRRHKKCDEARPSCMTCITKGYKCDGYATVPSKKGTNTNARSPAKLEHVGPVQALEQPALLACTPREQRYFEIFCSQTVPQLAGGFESLFWQTFIPQASCQISCIRHAAIALAALNEDLAQGKQIAVDTYPHGSDSDFTMSQYSLAIKTLLSLVQETGDGSREIVLSVCILFICFELLRGNHNAVLLHTQSGMNVLTDIMNNRSRLSSTRKPSLIPLEAIAPVFTRLDVQASDILSAVPPTTAGKTAMPLTPSPVPPKFEDLERSKQCLLEYQNYFMSKAREVVNVHGPNSANWPRVSKERLLRMRSENMAVLRAWQHAHKKLVQESGFDKDPRATRASNVLHVHRLFLTIALSRFPSLDEMHFDEFTPLFEEMVVLARKVFEITPSSSRGQHMTVSFDLGVAEPLFYVVSRCRVPRLRRDALEMLRKCPQNEGIWNSHLACSIGEKIIDTEERASPSWPNVQSEKDVTRAARILEALPRLVKNTGELVVSFRDLFGNRREERVQWVNTLSHRLSLNKSHAQFSTRRLQSRSRTRLSFNFESISHRSHASGLSCAQKLPSKSVCSPPVLPVPMHDEDPSRRQSSAEPMLDLQSFSRPTPTSAPGPGYFGIDEIHYDDFSSTNSTPWHWSPAPQDIEIPDSYQPFLDQAPTVGWAVH